MKGSENSRKHFVLVHGACHGAWSWFKLVTLLRSEGHLVTAIDLAASGVRPESFSDVQTFRDYSQPLLDLLASLPEDEAAILVGHSLGGLNLAFAMESFPGKISTAVFVSAFMPDCSSPPSSVLEQYFSMTPPGILLDTQFTPERHKTGMLFGPKCLSLHFYQKTSAEDLTLGLMLVRPGSLFLEDLSVSPKLSEEKYGSVCKVYIVCKEDKGIPEEFQRWMIKNNPPEEVMEIEGADHMPMLSTPKELSLSLLKVADSH
ncbi:salicylic acid-binding protein 2-like [Aristolochia californica]|uniref:salicylic acid-binding protein 2-like n=1 Tax=Aristolochia californica TaxID=171875 RepID=UPI0035E13957